MIKLTFCLRRKDGMSREEFHDYWLNNHAPLVRSVKDVLGIKRYAQVHGRTPSALSASLQGSRGNAEPYDGIAELWFESEAAIEAAMANPKALEAAHLLLEDEKKFIDLPNSPLWYNDEHEIIGEE